jgi:hypothetical protein
MKLIIELPKKKAKRMFRHLRLEHRIWSKKMILKK